MGLIQYLGNNGSVVRDTYNFIVMLVIPPDEVVLDNELPVFFWFIQDKCK